MQRFPALDGLRALAVGIVMVGHFADLHGVPASGAWAAIGVEVFFVLSGFLITSLLLTEYDNTGWIQLGRFYLRRSLRIFPAYYAYLLISIFLPLMHSRGEWVSAVSYTYNYFRAMYPMSPQPFYHLWSLAAEEQFYLLWPVTLWIALRRGRPRAIKIVLVVLAAAFAWRLYLVEIRDASLVYVRFAFEARVDALAAGCLLALSRGTMPYEWIEERIARRPWQLLLAVTAFFAVTITLTVPRLYVWAHTANAALGAVLLMQILALGQRGNMAWLDYWVLRRLGGLSYAMYLWHVLALAVGIAASKAPGIQFIVGIVLTMMAAITSRVFIEQPALRWRDRITGGRPIGSRVAYRAF